MESLPSNRDQVLRELEYLAQGQHPDQQTPLMRFTRCADWLVREHEDSLLEELTSFSESGACFPPRQAAPWHPNSQNRVLI